MKPADAILEATQENRGAVLVASGALIVAIVLLDWKVKDNVYITFGLLYILPILLAAGCLSRPQILALALLCTYLRETFSPFPWDQWFSASAFLTLIAFSVAGLFAGEMIRNRQLAILHARQLEEQIALRHDAEEQLRVLIESNPAAIFTVDEAGKIGLANDAAHRLLGSLGGSLQGQPIAAYLPALATVPPVDGAQSHFRTSMECTGRRRDGSGFLADIWFATYNTRSGPRLAAVVLDASEQLRDRESLGLHSMMNTSRILVGAVLHEVRNLCAAAGVAHTNLKRLRELEDNEDFQALGTLVKGLGRFASSELGGAANLSAASVSLRSVLDELEIVLGPSFEEDGARIRVQIPDALPLVGADHQSLMQVFLNLAQNSLRALHESPRKELNISATVENSSVLIRFLDSGAGVASPERLFRPFQPEAETTGLGLYVSRALLRAQHGDLYFEPHPSGTCFVVRLPLARRGARV
jgi:two-component system, LuxR family, sensor kinase FixL